MKKLLRSLIFNTFSLYLAINFLPGISLAGGFPSLALTGAVLAGFNLLVKPLLNLLLLPINLLTLGMFRWVINVLLLYLLILVIPSFQIKGFAFPGFAYRQINLPPAFISPLANTVLSSFFLSFISGFLFWLCGTK